MPIAKTLELQPDPAPLLAAHDLACRRADRRLFHRLSLGVLPGQLLWVRGDNGRGKTSLLRLLAGLSTPDQGRLSWARAAAAGLDADGGPAPARVYIGHHNALKDDLSAHEALQFLARLHRLAADPAAIDAALEAMGVQRISRAWVRTLSQGQRRRVALARLALERMASVWLLDEPYDALDAQGSERLGALLQAHRLRGGAVVLTSHQALGWPQALELDLNAYV